MVGVRRLGYVPALDGVRGIAIAAVTGVHFFHLPGGAYGVDVFFVLSGFLITTLLLEEHATNGAISLGAFYLRRARRLLPALGGLVVFVVMFGGLVGYAHGRLIEILAAGALYAANIVRAVFPSVLTGTPLDHMWSLAMEEQFYLVWPFALILLLRRRVSARRMMIGLATLFVALLVYRAGLVVAGASQHRVYFAPDTHGGDGLVAGCLLAFLRRADVKLPRWSGWAALATLAAGFTMIGGWRFNITIELPVLELASAVLILAVTERCAAARLLSLRPIVWLGTISYTLYVWQQPARWLIPGPHAWPELALTAGLTLFSFYLLERPFRRRRSSRVAAVEPVPTPAALPAATSVARRGSWSPARCRPRRRLRRTAAR